ncbi:MAG: rRNA adenine N-6-methyltransferase family protein, partial [Bdellovibrionota bacterium]
MEKRGPHKEQFAKKSLGQNFLVDTNAIKKIVDAVPENTPLLLEIGPGRG